jgi:general secretion pathway protein C
LYHKKVGTKEIQCSRYADLNRACVPDNHIMQTQSPSLWWLRITTFALAALAAASATYWALKWTSPPRTDGVAALPSFTASNPQLVAQLLGGGQTSTQAASPTAASEAARRLQLTGVVADQAIGGYALISVDGNPAQPFRVGAQVNESLVLQSVAPRSAALATGPDAPALVTLDLPQLNDQLIN